MPPPFDRPLLAPLAADLPRMAAVAALCVAAMAASLLAEPGLGGVLAAGLVPVLAAIAIWDARLFLIPDELSAVGVLLGLAAAGLTADGPVAEAMALALARGAVCAGLFLAIRWAYGRLRGREGLGLGDVKLAGVAGIWLGPTAMAMAVELAAVSGLAAYAARQLGSGRAIRGRIRLPFGLFFAPAIWIAWILERVLWRLV